MVFSHDTVRKTLLPLLVMVAAFPAASGEVSARVQPESRAGDVQPTAQLDSAFTSILASVVDEDGYVDYAALRGPLRADFRQVVRAVETFDVSGLETRAEKLAFWMNAYNVQMLQHIVEADSLTNVIAGDRDERFFRTPYLTAGLSISLDEIENGILRGPTPGGRLAPHALETTDPRLHAGVNCAAVSCPRLRMRAFTAENVDVELDTATREFVSSPRHFRIERGVLVASSIIDWYGADFDRPGKPAGDWLLSFMDSDRPDAGEIRRILAGRSIDDLRASDDVRFEYDWTVNDRAIHE